MKTDVSGYINRIRVRTKRRHRIAAFLTAMSLMVSSAVFWQLRGVGTAMEDEYYCGKQEHTHSDECYETVLVCQQQADSSAKIGDSAADNGESRAENADNSHISSEGAAESTPEKTPDKHEHTEKCFERRLICGLDEHKHTSECSSDASADVETKKDWEKTLPEKLTDDVRQNVLLVAKSQLGYKQSEKNFRISQQDDKRSYYSRYGQWYGNPYGEWSTMFTYFCMYYGGVDKQTLPYGSGTAAWASELERKGLLLDVKSTGLTKGDVILLDSDLDSKADRSAVVSEVKTVKQKTVIYTVEGDVGGAVAETSYKTDDEHILGCVSLENSDGTLAFEKSSGSGIRVNAKAKKGTFPEGTRMTVTDIAKSKALKTAEAALGKDRTIEDAVAVDITFKDAKGKKIEPADSKNVQVQIKLPDKIKFDKGEYSLLHVIDDNNVKKVNNANITAQGAEFETESFSIFVLTRDKGYVEPGQLVMLGEKGKGNNSEDKPYMIYIGETISVRYIGDNKDTGKFTVFNNNDYIVRTPDGHDSAPEGENYKQATFIGNKAGKCRIVFLSHGQWSEADVENDLWVQVVDPIYVKTYYGDKGKDFIKEYLGGYEWIDWVRDKNGYIQNTSGKPYTLRVGDVISVRSNAAGSFEMQGDGSTYLRKVGEQGGYTLYEAIAPTPDNSPAEIQHKNGNTVNDRLYVKVMPTTNNGYTHCDMEIADDGKYTLTEFTQTGKIERVYKAYVTKINSDTILRDANGDEVNRMPVDAYRKLGNPGQTQYEMTSAYYVGRYGYLGDTNLLHLDEYKVYTQITDSTTNPPTKEWVEWHPGDPKDGDLFFDKDTHYEYQFDPNKVKSVDFNVEITLYPDEEIVYSKSGTDTYTESSRRSIENDDTQVIENTQVHFEGQPLIDAMNKCPLDNGLDFTYQPAGALVKLQANKELTNVGLNAREGQFDFEIYSYQYQAAKVGNVNGAKQLPNNTFDVTDVFPNAAQDDVVQAFQLVKHGELVEFATTGFDKAGFDGEFSSPWELNAFCSLIDDCRIGSIPTQQQQEFYNAMAKHLNENAAVSAANGRFTDLANGHYMFRNRRSDGTVKNDKNGKVSFPYLAFSEKDKGRTFTYYMREIPDPDNADVKTYDETIHEVKITIGEDMSVTVKYDGLDDTPTFRNTLKQYHLPDTGGCGVIPHICTGTGLICTAAVLLRRRKRRKSG